MADIIHLHELTHMDMRAEEVITGVMAKDPLHVFVIAWPEDGSMPTYHSTTSDFPTVLMRLREFEHKYFNGDFSGARA